MKKFIALLIMAIISMSVSAMAAGDIKVYVNGEQVEFDVKPVIENERTLVPMRAIFEALGAEVDWNQETETVSAVRGSDTVRITINSNQLFKNDKAVELDVPAKIIDERTLVPVRAISESFDADVQWDGETQTVNITMDKVSPTEEPVNNTDENIISSNTLTEADMQALKDSFKAIRYTFEQSNVMNYVAENKKDMYDRLGNAEAFSNDITNLWNKTVAAATITVQMNSDTTYDFDVFSNGEGGGIMPGDDIIIDYFKDIITKAEMEPTTVFDSITTREIKNKARIGLVALKSANESEAATIEDAVIQCKYLGITALKDGTVRYFTLEGDPFDNQHWYFCEVEEDSRGTLSILERKNNNEDLDEFISLITKSL